MDSVPTTEKVTAARRRGLSEEVADRLREAIFGGAYAPGEPLREVELAAALDVSRGPVREALVRLEQEGLVRSVWHRGASVTTLSPDDVTELDSLRDALEQLAVRRVVAHASDSDLAALETTIVQMTHAVDEHQMVRSDIAFHDAVYTAAHHQRLQQAWQAIRSQVHLFLLTRIGISTEGYLTQVPAEHRALINALHNRNVDTALHLFAEHRKSALTLLKPPGPTKQQAE